MWTREDSDVKWFWGWPEENKCVLGFWRNVFLRSRNSRPLLETQNKCLFLFARNNDDVWNHRSVSSRRLITCPGCNWFTLQMYGPFRNKSKSSNRTAESVDLVNHTLIFEALQSSLLWHQTRSISCPPWEQSAGSWLHWNQNARASWIKLALHFPELTRNCF